MKVHTVPDFDPDEFKLALQRTQGLLVVCLCAQWCGTCRDFEAMFAELAAAMPQATWLWLDIEDDCEVVGDVDVENFPTLAIQQGNRNFFFGTSLPKTRVIRRMVENALESPARSLGDLPAELNFIARLPGMAP